MRETIKSAAGTAVSALPQCRFEHSIFVIAHMRCGSTALSNILCTRADVSGYGEAHISYLNQTSLGRLVVNQALRGAWKPRAPHLFDKILHSRYDQDVPAAFLNSRAIFMVRRPGDAVRSIRKLFSELSKSEYRTDEAALDYYVERVEALGEMWIRFDPSRRVGLTHSDLIADPNVILAQVSQKLRLTPPLENSYTSLGASRRGGGGDPTKSGIFTKIERRKGTPPEDRLSDLQVPDSRRNEAMQAYENLVACFLDDVVR